MMTNNNEIIVGPLNLITDVPGLSVGNAENQNCITGSTILLPDNPAFCGVDIRGGGPGTRETDLLAPHRTVERIDGLCLSGGSAFGLDAASGAQHWLKKQGKGFAVGPINVPIVPAAIIFDLLNGGYDNWAERSPYFDLGYQACENISKTFNLGNHGAGLGAQSGPLKGGLGSASFIHKETGYTVGAIAVVNSLGTAVMDANDCFWTWYLEQGNELGGQTPPQNKLSVHVSLHPKEALRNNTTIAIVATDAPLNKSGLTQIANMAQTGMARSLRPVHAPLDGDTVFALSTTTEETPETMDPVLLTTLGSLAADCLSRSIMRGVYEATSLGATPDYRQLHSA